MKKSFQKPVMRGKHCINLYVDFDQEDAGCFITGHYDVHKSMLIAAAMENPSFGRAFLDAALEIAAMLNQEGAEKVQDAWQTLAEQVEKGGNHD